jgi:exodeoxyribonuclease VII small subunit
MPAKSDAARPAARGFEDRLSRLEKLAEKLREGKLPLEEAVAMFEEGMRLAKSLEKDLSRVERRVEILTGEPDSGDEEPSLDLFSPETQPGT